MANAIWKGSINFGLVHVPVALHSAEQRNEISFKLLDGRDNAPVRYKRVNEETGKEVEWDEIVKGFEYEPEHFIVVNDADFKAAQMEATQSIDIEHFVDPHTIPPIYFEKPYYLVPTKGGEKGYVLLREALKRVKKAGLARLVMRSREYVALLYPIDKALVVDLLRYKSEIRPVEELTVPSESLKELKISEKEVEMAERLVREMSEEWKPEKYKDRYSENLLAVIEEKISGESRPKVKKAQAHLKHGKKVIDMVDLLRQSLEEKKTKTKKPMRKAG